MNAESAHSQTKINSAETTLVLGRHLIKEIHSHASLTYPEECCGLLVGRFEQGSKIKLATRSMRMSNVFASEERYHRYTIDPMEFLKAETEIESSGEEIVGIYHSHPNAPAKPSEYDRNRAWPSMSYVVVEVRDSKPVETRSWLLKEDRSEFLLEEMVTKEEAQVARS
jgi:proteasome lid subunit RPN8/RPN11